MTEPTFKQVNYATKLGIEHADKFSKEELIKLIDEKVGKEPKKEEKTAQNGSKGEIHLTIESVRSNALNSAIEWRKTLTLTEQEQIDLFTAAKKFEDYILNGVK